MCSEIPLVPPSTPLLDSIEHPEDLRCLEESQLEKSPNSYANIYSNVGQTGGHFGAGLGVVEHYSVTLRLQYTQWPFGLGCRPPNLPPQDSHWRRKQMLTMRRYQGLQGFKRSESDYDTFGVGHSSTSISAALGMAIGSEMHQRQTTSEETSDTSDRKHIAVIGDGAMTAGMAFEALNHAAHTGQDLLVILNDNNMSISPTSAG